MMMSLFKSFFRRKKLEKVASENKINFNAVMGLSINNNLVREFDYLLRNYSEGKLSSFDDLSKIYEMKEFIISAIDDDLRNSKTREEERLGVSRLTAENNLENLRFIIVALSNYYEAELE